MHRNPTNVHQVLLCGALLLLQACSDGSSSSSPSATMGGGTGVSGGSNGGGSAVAGGAPWTGGAPGVSSAATSSGATAAGGAPTAGEKGGGGGTSGAASTIGVGSALASGGTTTTGGRSATAGRSATGGASVAGGTGGQSAAGGTSLGGASSGGASSGGTTSAGGVSTSAGGSAAAGAAATIPNQTGNPLYGIVNTYTSWLSAASGDAAKLVADRTLADNMITWQMPHGGWFKYGKTAYAAPWNGTAPRSDWTGANGVQLGTIDNGGTVTEIMFLADVYRRSDDTKYRDAARKGLDFVLTMQYATGGFPQVYPARPNSYSNYVTFNDDAMVRVLGMLDAAVNMRLPFGANTFSAAQVAQLSVAIGKAVDYILRAQIVQNGVKTVWCAQHDPTTYVPRGARSYELPSKSGKESVGIIGFLLSQPQTPTIRAAVQAAVAWYKSDAVKVANTAYVSRPSGSTDDTYNPIQTRAGSTMWYRFYDLDKDTGFFSGRLPTDNPPGMGKQYDIMDIEAERRYGYQWGGSYGTPLFAYTDRIGS